MVTWKMSDVTFQADMDDFQALLQDWYNRILRDMREQGLPYTLWHDSFYKEGMDEWLEERDAQVSHIGYLNRSCFGFKTDADRLLFKLTWGGA